MASSGVSRPSKWKVLFAGLVVLSLAVGAAGTATAADAKLKDLGHGVTASEIKLGIAIIDYDVDRRLRRLRAW